MALMPHLKCVRCRIRIRSPHSPVGGIGELCPSCGALLEPVPRLSELVGFQEVRTADAGLEAIAQAVALPVPPVRGD